MRDRMCWERLLSNCEVVTSTTAADFPRLGASPSVSYG